MSRDPLDADLMTLCTEAERAAISLRVVTSVHAPLAAIGSDALSMADALDALSTQGRHAHTERNVAHDDMAAATRDAQRAAEAALTFQGDSRRVLKALEAMGDEEVGLAVHEVRALLRLKGPRLEAGLAQVRRLRDHLQRPSHPLSKLPLGQELLDRALALEPELAAAVATRDARARARRTAVRQADRATLELRSALGRLRRVWNLVRHGREHAVPELVFELAAGVVARWKDTVTPTPPPEPTDAAEAPTPTVPPAPSSPTGTTWNERPDPMGQVPSPTEDACARPDPTEHDATAP